MGGGKGGGGGGGSGGVAPDNSAASAGGPATTSLVCDGPNPSPVEAVLPSPAASQAATGLAPAGDSCGQSHGEVMVAGDSLEQENGDQERQRADGGLVGKKGIVDEDSVGGGAKAGAADGTGDGTSAASNDPPSDGQQAQGPPCSSSSAMEISSPCPDGAGGD